MSTRPVSTRISRQAYEVLEARSTRGRMGPSQYASRLLEWALLVAEEADLAAASAASGGPPAQTRSLDFEVLRSLLVEQFYTSSALERFLGKQPGLSEQLRREAAGRAAALVEREAPAGEAAPRRAKRSSTPGREAKPEQPPSKGPQPDAARAALLARLIGGPNRET